MNIAVILAAGKGTRIKHADKPKQFLKVRGKPILCYTVEKFLASDLIDHVVIAVNGEWFQHTQDILADLQYNHISVCEGADSRQASLFKALIFCEEHLYVPEDAIIVSHDAVRPLVTQEIIKANIQAINNIKPLFSK